MSTITVKMTNDETGRNSFVRFDRPLRAYIDDFSKAARRVKADQAECYLLKDTFDWLIANFDSARQSSTNKYKCVAVCKRISVYMKIDC